MGKQVGFTLYDASPVVAVVPKSPMVFRGGPRAHFSNPAAQDYAGIINMTFQMIKGVYPKNPNLIVESSFAADVRGMAHTITPSVGIKRPYIAQAANTPMALTLS